MSAINSACMDKVRRRYVAPGFFQHRHAVLKCILQLLKDPSPNDPTKYSRMAAKCTGVIEEMAMGVHRLKEVTSTNELLSPAINVKDCVTNSKSHNVYGCRHSLPDGTMRAPVVFNSGRCALVREYGDVGKGCAFAAACAI